MKNRWITVIYGLSLAANALLYIPQAVKIFKEKSSQNVLLVTFSGFFILLIIAFLYGVANDDKVQAVGSALGVIACGSVLFMAIIYRMPRIANTIH